MICQYCSQQVPDDAATCPHCGAATHPAPAASQPAAAPQAAAAPQPVPATYPPATGYVQPAAGYVQPATGYVQPATAGYPQAGYVMPMAVQQQSNPLAIVGMVLGIFSVVFFWAWYLGIIAAVVGLVLSIIGIVKANSSGGTNRGMAIAGLICSIVGLLIWVIIFALAAAWVSSL